jgi:propionyl-CoA carboxylase alpha chain
VISRLLVANRGEIARRIFRTASAMGIHTAAVYADGDAGAPFVRDADDAVALGGRTATETYLNVERLLDAARRVGADAVHPGYGFLSENADFASAVIAAGLVWVGPSPEVIATMGDKLTAKRLMADAGVPVLESIALTEGAPLPAPGSVTYPALVKAAAGGGGRGMRVVGDAAELEESVVSARREALAAFGDGRVFLERYVSGARHVEVQILGDQHGNLVHCFERECSIQRRHQKIIEEAPSPAVDAGLRARLGAAALTAAKAVGYQSAGTVEFLLSHDGSFFFLEINTRLQVEHPVTEMITGLDLVREQLLVARGERLAFGQADLSISGHAVEARVYAEDPERDFLPSTGTLLTWQPATDPTVRVDSGVETGTDVPLEFDPMLAKVISHAPSRVEAVGRLALALERSRIQGVVTNRDFLVATLRHPEFVAGQATTAFLDEADPERKRAVPEEEIETAAIVAALVQQDVNRRHAPVLTSFPSGWRNSVMPPEQIAFTTGDRSLTVQYQLRRDGAFAVTVGDRSRSVRVWTISDDEAELEIDGRRVRTTAHRHGDRWWVHGAAGEVVLDEVPRFPLPEAEAVVGGLSAPMPGRVVTINVAVGDRVEGGQVLLVLEAMKMEHQILAPEPGTITELRVTEAQQVANGDLLVVVEAAEGASG